MMSGNSWPHLGSEWFASVDVVEGIVCVMFRQAIGLFRDRFSYVDEEHLDLQIRPAQSITKRLPGQAVDTP